MKKFLILMLGMYFLLGAGGLLLAQPEASGYTLSDIYYYLTEGIEATCGGHSMKPQSGVPGQNTEGFTKSLEDIYYYMAETFGQCNLTYDRMAVDYEQGNYFFCTDSNYWGVREGTISSPTKGGEWILVPGDSEIGTEDFWVMKYEAKQVNGAAFSQATETPWRYIDLASSSTACSNLGVGYHLCTVKEAQTINRNLEQVAANWSGGSVGSGGLYRGNSQWDDALGYEGDNPESGTGRNIKARLTLSNGSEIWDWSGNVGEWIWGEGANGAIGTSGGITWYIKFEEWDEFMPSWELIEWNDSNLDGSPGERSVLGPSNSSWTSAQGMGKYFGNNSSHAFIRGGGNFGMFDPDGRHIGVFSLNMERHPTSSGADIGFRCCR